jgi:hypothetical protein
MSPSEQRADRAFDAFAVLYGLAVWWPTRALPYHWDGATFVVDASRDLLASGFHPLVANHSAFAHPPLFTALLALAWQCFGDSRLVSHALVLPSLPAAMIATHRLGVLLGDRVLGVASAILFGGVAVVVAEYGQIYMDLPLAAVLTWGVLAWMHGRLGAASTLFSLAALTKLLAPLTVPAALLLVVASTVQRRRHAREYIALSCPFAVVGLWLVYHRAVTGWLLSRPELALGPPPDLTMFARMYALLFDRLLLGQWRWVLLFAALGGAAWVRMVRKQAMPFSPIAPLFSIVFVGCLFFVAAGEFGLRYGIYLLPPYIVATLYVLRAAVSRATHFACGVAVLFAFFVTTWHPRIPLTSSYAFAPDENLAYLDLIAIGARSARWLEREHRDSEIVGTFPESYQLTEPWQGYVDAPLRFSSCSTFERHPGVTQIVYMHGYARGQLQCRRIIQALGARPLRHFESNGKWLELYQVPQEARPDPEGGP